MTFKIPSISDCLRQAENTPSSSICLAEAMQKTFAVGSSDRNLSQSPLVVVRELCSNCSYGIIHHTLSALFDVALRPLVNEARSVSLVKAVIMTVFGFKLGLPPRHC
jgi:hypothetical protein